ncbi:hypothetical protein CEXT_454261 [Caerostris extrusa]|uniref:Uncharacterized protein n=1 Tax=Caerostris extrusa TaxID=172846 RepID=A0AAV4SGU3_CAEEX|nr:hypothetical protein CEXT_454261 [Caerostris extrusa]
MPNAWYGNPFRSARSPYFFAVNSLMVQDSPGKGRRGGSEKESQIKRVGWGGFRNPASTNRAANSKGKRHRLNPTELLPFRFYARLSFRTFLLSNSVYHPCTKCAMGSWAISMQCQRAPFRQKEEFCPFFSSPYFGPSIGEARWLQGKPKSVYSGGGRGGGESKRHSARSPPDVANVFETFLYPSFLA